MFVVIKSLLPTNKNRARIFELWEAARLGTEEDGAVTRFERTVG